jgi:glutaminyl-tRNA synthetase
VGNRGGADEPAPARHTVVAGDEDAADDDVERNYLDDLNPESKRVVRAFVEPALAAAAREERFQFERHGYFVADLGDHAPGAPVFNRSVSLKDSWAK